MQAYISSRNVLVYFNSQFSQLGWYWSSNKYCPLKLFIQDRFFFSALYERHFFTSKVSNKKRIISRVIFLTKVMIFLSLPRKYTRKKMIKCIELVKELSSRISSFRLKSIVRASLSGKKSLRTSFLWAWRHVIKGGLVRSTRQLIVSRTPCFSSKKFLKARVFSLRSFIEKLFRDYYKSIQ